MPENVAIVVDSTDTARQIYSELLNEYKLSLDQILEITGFLCATAIAKVGGDDENDVDDVTSVMMMMMLMIMMITYNAKAW